MNHKRQTGNTDDQQGKQKTKLKRQFFYCCMNWTYPELCIHAIPANKNMTQYKNKRTVLIILYLHVKYKIHLFH